MEIIRKWEKSLGLPLEYHEIPECFDTYIYLKKQTLYS